MQNGHDTEQMLETFGRAVPLDPGARDAFLQELEAGGDAAQARELERLLELDQADGPLPREPEPVTGSRAVASARPAPAAEICAPSSPSIAEDDKYEILGAIGEGAFGHIYRARHRQLQREVALKVHRGVPDSCRARILAEAQALARVSHPNVVTIHDVRLRGGDLLLELELIEGENLHQIVERAGPLAPREAALIALELCRALAAIHAAGLVHMDVKPANVMRASGGRIVLLDFGLTRRCLGDGPEVPLGGTPAFMAPECYQDGARVGPAADIYSLGVTLYWLVSGRYPYPTRLVQRLRWQVLKREPRPLLDMRPDLPRDFVALVALSMQKEPELRYASMGDMEAALARFLGGAERMRPPSRRALVLGAGGVALAASAAWLFTREPAFTLEHEFRLKRGEEERVLGEVAEVQRDDRLSLMVRVPEPLYLYLFQEDGDGLRKKLFPLPDGPQNPLPTGAFLLPSGAHWKLNEPGGGADHLYLLASTSPLPSAERLVLELPAPKDSSRGEPDWRGVRLALRGDWGLDQAAQDTPPTSLAQCFEGLADAPRRSGRFFRRLVLRNP